MAREVSAEAWRALARRLDVEEAALRAVAEVESAGSGFLPPPSELPKVLFEGHAFHRLTGGRFAATHPDLSYPNWDRKKYSGTLAGEWKRLNAACLLDRAAALQSASWGAFQIMGFNFGLCGFADVEAFVTAQKVGADEQLAAFAAFIERDPFLSPLRAHAWAEFAEAYNGPAFARNKYDKKLAAAYARHAGTTGPTPPSPASQSKLPPGRPELVFPPYALPPSIERPPAKRAAKRPSERAAVKPPAKHAARRVPGEASARSHKAATTRARSRPGRRRQPSRKAR